MDDMDDMDGMDGISKNSDFADFFEFDSARLVDKSSIFIETRAKSQKPGWGKMNTENINTPVFIPESRRLIENRSAQRHSKNSKSGMCPMGLIGHIGLIGITPAVE